MGEETRELEMQDRKESEGHPIDSQAHVASGFSGRECICILMAETKGWVRKEGYVPSSICRVPREYRL